jgi:hypothetical protein
MLYDPPSHEPLTERPWDEGRVRAAIAAIVADTEGAFAGDELWPAHPVDVAEGPLPKVSTVYLGAAGVIWAPCRLQRSGLADLRRDWAPFAARLYEHYLAQPDFRDTVEGAVPSLWMGEAGILVVAHTLAPAAWQEKQLLAAVRANVANPSWELMWGSPGTMIAARVMHERAGAAEWAEAWTASADRLLAQWQGDVWRQELYGRPAEYLGPAHGFAGNVLALAQGGLLDPARRAELERRTIATLLTYAMCEDGLCQWPPATQPSRSPQPIRTQGATARRGSSPRSPHSHRRTGN